MRERKRNAKDAKNAKERHFTQKFLRAKTGAKDLLMPL